MTISARSSRRIAGQGILVSLGWAWRTSRQLNLNVKLRVKFVLAAVTQLSLARELETADRTSPLGSILLERPETVGALIWPYQCSAWSAKERFARISGHFDAIAQFAGLNLAPDDKLVLEDLSSISPGVTLLIDRPPWLAREGHLTLSLFKGDFRAFTLSFSLFNAPELELFIGGIQGRQDGDILALYRDLTKDFHGIRPRDFMLEALRLFGASIGARHIYAVADAYKISRHEFFGKAGAHGLFYDEMWDERGGVRVAETHYELPLAGTRRGLEEIPSKKRSMYRRRYEMLDQIAAAMPRDLAAAERRRFDAK
jgi:uncharacterized protein VirK/YbjX